MEGGQQGKNRIAWRQNQLESGLVCDNGGLDNCGGLLRSIRFVCRERWPSPNRGNIANRRGESGGKLVKSGTYVSLDAGPYNLDRNPEAFHRAIVNLS
jgi:hypothetical protein